MLVRKNHAYAIDARELVGTLNKLKAMPEVAAFLNEPRAADMLERGKKAQARGKLKVARLFYQTAARLSPAPSANLAQTRLLTLQAKLASE